MTAGLRVLLFPWGIWSATALLPRWLERRLAPGPGLGRAGIRLIHALLYAVLGLPATLVVGAEILISANEWLIGEQADYRLQSDFLAGLAETPLVLPGPPSWEPPPVPAGPTEAYRRYLVERFAPVIVQKIAHHPEWDIPVALDFDGNGDPRDNVANEPSHRPHVATVHGELTAETRDSYYLTYSLYHVKDYDHPLREWMTDWTFHDSDNEGLMVRVDKASLEVVQLETWFHNRFLLYDRTGTSRGSEPVHGAIHLEGAGHALIYSQPQGHGVRALQVLDRDALEENAKILRHRGDRPAVPVRADRSVQVDATYELVGFDDWYVAALGPFGSEGRGSGLFEDSIRIGVDETGREIRIGRFIAGRDYSKVGWSRPKPPWSWDDGWDRIPVFVWHFLPSVAFASHSGLPLSQEYLYNRPMEKTFGRTPEEMRRFLRLEIVLRRGEKWDHLETRGGNLDSRTYWSALQLKLKEYVNYVFHALG